jgi:ASC-1-like (ASCH) protein
MIVYKIKIFKKAFEMILDKRKTIDLIFKGDKLDDLQIGDEIIYRNAKETKNVIVKGILHFDNLETALEAVNTKNLISKSPVKALAWYSKNYTEYVNNNVMIINF